MSCSGDNEASTPKPTEPKVVLVPTDGGLSSTAIVAGTGVDPSTMQLDADTTRPVPSQPVGPRERRPIDVTLRSSPPGAEVAIDGSAIGVAPAFWSGFADGRQHEFVFRLPGHAIARYRFVPVSSGVIHARLEPIIAERDAGLAPPLEVVPHPPPSAIVPPALPPTIVPDAAVAPGPGAGSSHGSSHGSAHGSASGSARGSGAGSASPPSTPAAPSSSTGPQP
jgi:hypothetical protein